MRGKLPYSTTPMRVDRNIPAYAGKTSEYDQPSGGFWEHPRVCGENTRYTHRKENPMGTSPRMRGKRGKDSQGRGPARNIPAYAGKTVTIVSPTPESQEHPRVCGENNLSALGLGFLVGTSPRMRGKPQTNPAYPNHTGNIPAYAGKTRGLMSRAKAAQEHPRVCGENSPPDF